MKIIKAIFRVIVGAVLGVASGIALAPAIAAFAGEAGDSAWLVWVVVAIGAALGYFAPTIRRALGRGFLILGASVFALPLSMMLLSGRVTSDMINQSEAGSEGMAALGGTIAGTMMTGAAALVGFFLGAIFLIIGLVLSLGGRREVIVVHQDSSGATYSRQPDIAPAPRTIDAARRQSVAFDRSRAATPINRDNEPTL